jgi:hypothetical protein
MIYVFIKLGENPIFYVVVYKKEKTYPVKSFIFITDFCLFFIHHTTSQILVKRCVAREDAHAKKLFNSFNILKLV